MNKNAVKFISRLAIPTILAAAVLVLVCPMLVHDRGMSTKDDACAASTTIVSFDHSNCMGIAGNAVQLAGIVPEMLVILALLILAATACFSTANVKLLKKTSWRFRQRLRLSYFLIKYFQEKKIRAWSALIRSGAFAYNA